MLEQKIEALTRAVEALTLAMTTGATAKADAVKAADPIPEPALKSPTPAPTPAFDDQALKDVTLAKSRAGHREAVRKKLDDMGVKKLQDLAQDQAAEFYQWVVALGNN